MDFRDCVFECERCRFEYRLDGAYASIDGVLKRVADRLPSPENIRKAVVALASPQVAANSEAVRAVVEDYVPEIAPFLNQTFGRHPREQLKYFVAVVWIVLSMVKVLSGSADLGDMLDLCTRVWAGAKALQDKQVKRNRAKRARRPRRQ